MKRRQAIAEPRRRQSPRFHAARCAAAAAPLWQDRQPAPTAETRMKSLTCLLIAAAALPAWAQTDAAVKAAKEPGAVVAA